MSSQRRRLSPNSASEWQKVIRDAVTTTLGTFIAVYEVVYRTNPSPVAIGFALALFGLGPALRIDQGRRSTKLRREGKEDEGEEDNDPFEGPGGYYRT